MFCIDNRQSGKFPESLTWLADLLAIVDYNASGLNFSYELDNAIYDICHEAEQYFQFGVKTDENGEDINLKFEILRVPLLDTLQKCMISVLNKKWKKIDDVATLGLVYSYLFMGGISKIEESPLYKLIDAYGDIDAESVSDLKEAISELKSANELSKNENNGITRGTHGLFIIRFIEAFSKFYTSVIDYALV